MNWLTAPAIVIGAALIAVVWLYNRLVADRNRVDAAWSDIDVQLKRRHDLLPKLVETVRHYAGYEQATLTRVTELREQSRRLDDVAVRAGLEQEIGGLTRRLFALAEAYPDLKASEQFVSLQRGITEVEDHIQMARRYYNGAVRILNTRVESFPGLLVARRFGFATRDYFEMED